MSLLLACLVAGAPLDPSVTEADRALRMGRPEQARLMIRTAVAAGTSGNAVDRLLADLAFTERRWEEASARYRAILDGGCKEPLVLERVGVSALQQGRLAEAIRYLRQAVRLPGANWSAWNALGVAADRQLDWAGADQAYRAGLKIAPDNPMLLNNLGWSLLLRGEWYQAHRRLAAAAAQHPGDPRVLANLELALAALSEQLPARRGGETNADFAARLNDAGVVALRQGNRMKAAAAFSRAIEAHDRWFNRAANNLASVERQAN